MLNLYILRHLFNVILRHVQKVYSKIKRTKLYWPPPPKKKDKTKKKNKTLKMFTFSENAIIQGLNFNEQFAILHL